MESEQEILGRLASTHISTLESSRKKRKILEEMTVHESTVPVLEEKKQKKMTESEEIIDPESEEHFFCTKCDVTFSQKASQKRRLETVHEIKKQFECECGEQFSTKKSLRRHENSVHSEVKKVFQCEFCDLKVSRKDNLKTHQENSCRFAKKGKDKSKKHFECKCGKQFSDKKGLQRHENSVHAKVKNVFQCQFCDLKSSRKDHLKTHQEKFCHFAKKGKEKSKKAQI